VSQPQVGTYFGVELVETGLCDLLSGQVAEFHANGGHPRGQHEMAFSPAVVLSTIEPDSIYARLSLYSHLELEDGVYFRVGWQFYPREGGSTEWSDRVGSPQWVYSGPDPLCTVFSSDGTAFLPPGVERVRLVFEVANLSACSTPSCGNASPLLDDLSIFVRGIPVTAGAPGSGAMLSGFRADRVWPNPAAGVATLQLSIPEPGELSVEVFSAAGRLVRALEARPVAPGVEDISWDGRTAGGGVAPSGVYLVSLKLITPTGMLGRTDCRIVRIRE
jgi:hypothetical protein